MLDRLDTIEQEMKVCGNPDGKRLLILSCDTGDGHNTAANAIQEAWTASGGYSVMVDAMHFISAEVQKSVERSYFYLAMKAPKTFGRLYRTGDLWSSRLSKYIPSPVYALNIVLAKQLYKYLQARPFDAIICTHLFPMLGLTNLDRKGYLKKPTFAVFTDYACYPFMVESELDVYFTPSDKVSDICIRQGMKYENFIASGIPVAAKFQTDMTRAEARKKLGYREDEVLYLLMGGGMGFGSPAEICKEIFARDREAKVLFLYGHNKQMAERLEPMFPQDRLELIPFTREVPVYMRAANVLLTKPGGLSSTEAIVTGIPLVHTTPIPGIETENLNFFTAQGLSLTGEDAAGCAEAAVHLVHDAGRRELMLKRQRETARPGAADHITRIIYSKIGENI